MAKKINLNDYLGHSMDCTCGKEHKTNLKIVDIDKDAVSRLPKHIEALGYKKPFLVADVNTWAAAGALVAEKLDVADISYKKYIFNEKELIPDEKTLGSLMMAFSRDCDVIVAVGSGTLNDLCKFSSFQLGLDYMVFATAPSMDGFVSIGLCKNYLPGSCSSGSHWRYGYSRCRTDGNDYGRSWRYSWKIHLPFRLENGTHYHRRILLQPYCRYGKRDCRNRCGRKYTN